MRADTMWEALANLVIAAPRVWFLTLCSISRASNDVRDNFEIHPAWRLAYLADLVTTQ